MSYAKGTTVSSERTRAEIEVCLKRFGADSFAYATSPLKTMIGFAVAGRSVRIDLPMPSIDEFKLDGYKRPLPPQKRSEMHDAEIRRRWRCLALVIKAKLAAVEDGISTVDREFMADVVCSDGRTLMETFKPQLDAARGKPLLLSPPQDEPPVERTYKVRDA